MSEQVAQKPSADANWAIDRREQEAVGAGCGHVRGKLAYMEPGERMLLWCEGGPSIGRATAYPPPLEIDVEGGIYVLVDDGPIENWHYQFVGEG